MAKRRASGEGSIRKRPDGRWEGRYVAGHDTSGKPIRKNVLGKSQGEVKEKLIRETDGRISELAKASRRCLLTQGVAAVALTVLATVLLTLAALWEMR